jgi:hypothetical protein
MEPVEGPDTTEMEVAVNMLIAAARNYAADWIESFAKGVRGDDERR